MTEKVWGISVERPVTNYDVNELTLVQAAIFKAKGFKGYVKTDFFTPLDRLAAVAVQRFEIAKLHESMGIEADGDHLEELGNHVMQSVQKSNRPESIDHPTKPAEVVSIGKRHKFGLIVAHSSKVKSDRSLIFKSIASFYNLPMFPEGLVLRKHTTGVVLARGTALEDRRLALGIASLINDQELLPEVTNLGPLAVRRHTSET